VSLLWEDPFTSCWVSLVVGAIMLIAFSIVLSPIIARFTAFSLLQVALGASYSSASFYFITDKEEQYADGPHFSKYFYNTVMGTVGGIFSLLGIYTYQKYLSKWNYRSIIVFSNVLVSLLSLVDIVMFTRLNVAWGIPDHFFVLSLGICDTITQQWAYMPMILMMAALCPKGMEATMYALLAGCTNLGTIIASTSGAYLLEYLEVQPAGLGHEGGQFDNLWRVAAVSAILPMFTVLLLYRLIPDMVQNSRVLAPAIGDQQLSIAPETATEGSLWRRWMAGRDRTD